MAKTTQVEFGERTLCKIEAKLRKYCHKDRCEDFDGCPQSCVMCRDESFKLNLDTAIAWNAADTVMNFMANIDDFNDELTLFYIHFNRFVAGKNHEGNRILMEQEINEMNAGFEDLIRDLSSIMTCRDIVAMHRLRYYEIFRSICRSADLFGTAVGRARVSLQRCETLYVEIKDRKD